MIYEEYSNSHYWKVIKKSVDDLINNGDIILETKKEYVVGYIVENILEKENS